MDFYHIPQKESVDPQDKEVLAIKELAAYHLVVAILIATVSFTADFTLPGGLNQNPGENVGMALLSRETALKPFLVSDAMAFTFSGLAVMCYFPLVIRSGLPLIDFLYRAGYLLITLSLGMLIIAFVTGVCAVVVEFVSLSLALLAISAFFFLS